MNLILNNLSFSLNATMPIFLVMVIGWGLKKLRFLDDSTTAKLNQLVFKIFLPIAIHLGFRNEKLVAILVMLGSATTSSSFIMAIIGCNR